MAKIGKYEFSVNNSSTKEYFSVDLHYNVKNSSFIGYIPGNLTSKLELLSFEERQIMSITTLKVQGKSVDAFYGKSEQELRNAIYYGFKKLIDLAADKRPVILIWFRNDASPSWAAGHDRNAEHPPISIYYTLTYAMEERVNNSEPVYRMEGGLTFKLSSHRKAVVIDDTPEARVKLDDIYQMLKKLSAVLTEYTKDSTVVENLLNSSFKLLS